MQNVAVLLIEARRVLGLSQGALGAKLGSSERTGQRWERGGSPPSPEQLKQLAVLVHPMNASLAAEIAAAGGTSLEQIGLARPPPAASSAAAPCPAPPDPEHIVDTVVCAAAEAMEMMPDAVRPALRAAFRRARLAGLSIEAVEKALHAAHATEAAAPTGGKRKA